MLLNSETAVKAAHDVIHDSKEFFSKWATIVNATKGDVPEGYVDFEFADGALLHIPCVWYAMQFSEGAERPAITFKRGGVTAVWTPGTVSSFEDVASLISDRPVAVGDLSVKGIAAQNMWMTVAGAIVEYLRGETAILRGGSIKKISVDSDATIIGSTFKNLRAEGAGQIDAALTNARIDSLDVITQIIGGEKYDPVLKMNAFDSQQSTEANPLPETDAVYDKYLPFLPFDESARPVNGFGGALVNDPFYPDWFYTYNAPSPWRPDIVWVPSHARPSEPSWKDEDGLYWHAAKVSYDSSQYGAPCMIYPPRCRIAPATDTVLPPVRKAADGMVVTVKFLANVPVPVCVYDTYTRQADGTWYWRPGIPRQTRGACILQYILKRKFTETDGEISAIEYQFLPLGDSDGTV